MYVCLINDVRPVWICAGKPRAPDNGRGSSYYIPELDAAVERYNELSEEDRPAFVEERKKFVAERYMVSALLSRVVNRRRFCIDDRRYRTPKRSANGNNVSQKRNATCLRQGKKRMLRCYFAEIQFPMTVYIANSIEDRLVEMGYTRDDFPDARDPAWDSLVNQSRPLTSRS